MIYHLKYFTSGLNLPIEITDVFKKCMNCKWKRKAMFALCVAMWCYFSFTVCKYSTSRYGLSASQRAGNEFWLQVWDVRSCEILLWGSWGTRMFPRDIPIPLRSLFGPHRKSTVTCDKMWSEQFEHWNSLIKVQLAVFFSFQSCAMFIPDHSVLCWLLWKPGGRCLFHRTAASYSNPTLCPASCNGTVHKSPVLRKLKVLCADGRRAAVHSETQTSLKHFSSAGEGLTCIPLVCICPPSVNPYRKAFIYFLLSLLVILDSYALYYKEGESQLNCNADIYVWHMCVYVCAHLMRAVL